MPKTKTDDFRWLEPDIRGLYDGVNELMHRIAPDGMRKQMYGG